jgi:hypothetical protein
VNRNFLLHNISVYHHPRYAAGESGQQTVVLCRGLTVFCATGESFKCAFGDGTRPRIYPLKKHGGYFIHRQV